VNCPEFDDGPDPVWLPKRRSLAHRFNLSLVQRHAVIQYTLDKITLPRQVDPWSPNHPLLDEEGDDRMR
jgi:hypothetical protein